MASYTEEIDYDEGIRHEEENVNRINNSILIIDNVIWALNIVCFFKKSADGLTKGLQKKDAFFDVTGATVELLKVRQSTIHGSSDSEQTVEGGVIPRWIVIVKLASETEKIELGVESRENALNWASAIR